MKIVEKEEEADIYEKNKKVFHHRSYDPKNVDIIPFSMKPPIDKKYSSLKGNKKEEKGSMNLIIDLQLGEGLLASKNIIEHPKPNHSNS